MFRVQRKPCATCIYGRRSPSRRSIAELEAEIADPYLPGFFTGYRTCHHSDDVCCRGFWRRHKDRFTLGQIAQRLGLVVYVDIDTVKGTEE